MLEVLDKFTSSMYMLLDVLHYRRTHAGLMHVKLNFQLRLRCASAAIFIAVQSQLETLS
jgi:hypothetical protein